MHQHIVGLSTTERMAVDAAVLCLSVGDECRLFVCLKVALIYAHVLPNLVTRLDESVGKVSADAVVRDIAMERLKLYPLAFALTLNAHADDI